METLSSFQQKRKKSETIFRLPPNTACSNSLGSLRVFMQFSSFEFSLLPSFSAVDAGEEVIAAGDRACGGCEDS
jgi:hypothetical protein